MASLLPGFAPILLYIAVEALFGETAGLAAGLALGIGELLVILARERRVDAFTLADTLFLGAMGAFSSGLSDPRFFRLKPAVSEAVIAVLMFAGSLGPRKFFLPYLEKRLGRGTLPAEAARRLLAMIVGFGAVTLAHAALTAWAAVFWTKAAWNFIAGALFWILVLAYSAAWTLPVMVRRSLRRRTARDAEGVGEYLPVVDESGAVVGKAPRPACHAGQTGRKPLHPVVRLWLSDGRGGYWMQRRAETKLVQPGRWDCAVGGHVAYGETVEAALAREATEEIGAAAVGAVRPMARFVWETELERELVFVFTADLGTAIIRADGVEVQEIRAWSWEELAAELAKGSDGSVLTALAAFEMARIPGLASS